MSTLTDNTELYNYLLEHNSTTHYRFERIFGHTFPQKKLDLDSIEELKLDGIKDLRGIEELPNLKKVEIKGVRDLSALENCPSLTQVKANLPEQRVNVNSLMRLSQKHGMQNCEFYGRGVHSITSEQAMQFGKSSKISYDDLSKMTPEQFSQIQHRFEEIHSLITPEMTDVQKVETIYRHLLPQDFQYDWNNHEKGSNGYLINNTMYGPLVENRGVCSGIASALEHALRNEGLEAVSCGGWANTRPTPGDNHQWNQVKVDGEWYNLDLTNDYDKKSWRFFMKSDGDYDWAECHYADKEDKFEPVHDCTSTKYDEVYREDPTQRRLRELKKQKEEINQYRINSPLSSIDDPEYTDYRAKVNELIEKSPEDEYLRSQFTVYKNQEQQERCYHTIQTAREGEQPQTLLANDFEYSDKFRKGMMEPSIIDFSRRSPINSAIVTPTNQPDKQIQQANHTNAQPTQEIQETPCNVNLMSENNNMMSINNVDQIFAQQVQTQAQQIVPDVYTSQNQLTQQGPVLQLKIGGMGYINVILLAILSGIVISFLFLLGTYIFK